ncbi:hypothetical protein DB313_05565 (plasmid) [Borrelia turcica IST7]|uniref:Immunogenic protein P37 n=1 Tax=Borrelia turcica IST7 TaxID=1104446 RepID=A0A386PN87_9SPIR|nr:hypothetical protein [Borrelia turcica]AYE36964.1 hypothetical protein DB313_05565 [Borrelia turcica IST7]
MKLINKALIIISLVSSVMSCKLYDKLLDKVEESLDKQEVSVRSSASKPDTNAITDMQDSDVGASEQNSGRSGRRARSLDDYSQNEQEEVVNKVDSSGSEAEQNVAIVKEDKVVVESLSDKSKQGVIVNEETKELCDKANEIKSQAETRLVEVGAITKNLEQIKKKLDEVKTEVTNAETDFNKARRGSNSESKQKLLADLHKAIDKVRNSRNYADLILYNEAKGSLESSEGSFNNAKSQAEIALSDIKSIYRASGGAYYIHKAKEAMEGAEKLLEDAQRDQSTLKFRMNQVEVDFSKLKQAHEALVGIMN